MTALVLIISAFILYNYLDKTINSFKQDVLNSLENSIDKIITYESISPSILQYLEIRKLYITDTNGNCLLKSEKLRVSFSLYKYFFTKEFPVGTVYFENSAITYDHENDKEIVNKIISIIDLFKGKRSKENLKIKGKNITIISDIPSGQFKMQKVFLDIGFSKDDISLNMRTKTSGENIRIFGNNYDVKSELKLRGKTANDLSWHNYDIELTNFKANNVLLKKQNFNISYSDNKIKVIKTKARDPFDLYAEYDTENRIISLNSKAENYRPARYINYSDNDKSISGLLNSVYTGTAVLIYRFDDISENALTYSSDLSIQVHSSIIPFKNKIDTELSGNTNYISISKLQADTEKGILEFNGYYDLKKNLPDGRIKVKDLTTSDNLSVNTDTRIQITGENSLFILSDTDIGNLTMKNIECLLTRKQDSISYNISYINSDSGFISSVGTFFYNKLLLTSDTKINKININQILSNLNPDYSQTLSAVEKTYLSSSFYAETDFKSLNLFTNKLLIDDKKGEKSISSDLTVTKGNFILHNIAIDWGNYYGKGHIKINDIKDRYQINSYISLNNESYKFIGDYIQNSSLTLNGNDNLSLSMFFDNNRTVFFFNTDKFPFPVYSSVPEFSFNIKGESGNGQTNILLNNNKIYNLPFLKGEDSFISFSSNVSDSRAIIHNLTVKDNFSILNGRGEFIFTDSENINGWIRTATSDRIEEHLIMLDISNSLYEISADFRNFPSERIVDKSISGNLTGIFYFKGTKENPNYSINVNMNNGKLLDDPFSFNLSLNASNSSMIINNLVMRYNLNRIDSASGFISKDDNNYSFKGDLFIRKGISDKGSENRIILEGEIFDNSFEWFSNPFFIGNKGVLKVENNQNQNNDFKKWELSYINNESFLIFNGGPGNSIEGEITRKGLFDIMLSNPLPVTGNFKGKVNNSIIDSKFENIEIDLKTFGTVTDIAYFKTNSGTARGNLTLSGPVNDPDFNGHLNVSGVRARSVFVPADIILPNTSFIFTGKSLYMPETAVLVEENSIKGQLEFNIDHWLPREFIININTDPGKMLWIKHKFKMVDIDGFVSGNFLIDGDEQGLTLSGDVVAKKCIITLSDDEKDVKPKKKSSFDYEIDLNITSGPGVEFYWPSIRLPVLRTFASAGEKLTIYSNTATDEYSFNGDIKIQGGEVFYFSQSFFVKEGSIVFNENETKFDPHLTARAELRERTSDNNEVKISLIAEDTPLSRFSPRFESNPPLNENEIYALLGESVYSQFGGENITFGSALLSAGAYSTQLIGIFRPFETQMKNLLNLDLFTIRTNVLQQAFGNDNNEEVTLSDDNTPINNSYLDNTTIFMGKYFGEYFFLEGLLSFNTRDFDIYQYNDYDVPDFMGMYVRTELSLEVDTPLFLMDLTVYPQIKEFYDSLADTSLQFSWRFSY